MLGQSTAFKRVEDELHRISTCDAPVLIEGETGTGKELAARAIHYRGSRKAQPFIPVNCGALPDALVANELFGHRRGAYTDAREEQLGIVALARAGTLFLDEVDALSPKAQVTLLRFLQDQQFRPLGGHREEHADVRVVAASNHSLEVLAAEGRFRMDLFYRLKLMHVTLPPLRERFGDIALLARHFVETGGMRFSRDVRAIAPETLAWFDRYPWPGNVRELEHVVYRGVLLSDGPLIQIAPPDSLADPIPATTASSYRIAKDLAIKNFERAYLSQVISRANGVISVGARISGIERRYLGRLLKKHHLDKNPAQH